MKRKHFWLGFLAGFLILPLILTVMAAVGRAANPNGLTFPQKILAAAKISELSSIIGKNYLEETDAEDLLDGAYAGLAAAVGDKYTRYYTAEEYADYLEQSRGSFAGIGVTVQWNEETSRVHIIAVTEGGPADQAGILPEDEIISVDGDPTDGKQMDEIVKLIKGQAGTNVVVGVDRAGETLEFTVTRDVIEETTVVSAMMEDGLGYIALKSFNEVTLNQFEKAMEDLKSQGMKGLILDLRDNPGGRLQTVVDIADDLLGEGLITYTMTKSGYREEFTSDEASILDVPLVVLINGNSASASEILAGAIRDHGAGTLIGEKTFGKGIVQTTYSLWDGSAVKLTMARYYTPNGDFIHGVGIEPDIKVSLPKDADLAQIALTDQDDQFKEAVATLKELLAN